MMDDLEEAIQSLHDLVSAENVDAIEQVLDAIVSALEDADLIKRCYDVEEAIAALVDTQHLPQEAADAAETLVALTCEVEYHEFSKRKLRKVLRAAEALAVHLTTLLEDLREQE